MTNSCPSSPVLAAQEEIPNRGLDPDECTAFKAECTCFTPSQLQKIYDGLTAYRVCQIQLEEKDKYIKSRIVTWGAAQPIAFWQEPSFVVGGMVISASIGAAVTLWLVNSR